MDIPFDTVVPKFGQKSSVGHLVKRFLEVGIDTIDVVSGIQRSCPVLHNFQELQGCGSARYESELTSAQNFLLFEVFNNGVSKDAFLDLADDAC